MRSIRHLLTALAGTAALVLGLACGGSASSGSNTSGPAPTGQATVILTDAPSDQWSAIEVVVTKVVFLNKADHTREAVAFQGASARINLVDLDSVGELLASTQIPTGTYDALRISIDPASVNLVKADGTVVAPSQVRVGVPSVLVNLSADLVVTASGSNAVQLDFDLAHPLFLVQLPDGTWAMNLQIRHRPNANGMLGMAQMLFRHRRGTVDSVGASSFVMHADSGNDLTVNVDSGSRFFDADAKAPGSFAGLAAGKYVLASLRMQPDGSLWAVRVWYSATALPVWTPEGHLYGVDRASNRLLVSTSSGAPRSITIDADTVFTFRTLQPLGTGPAVLANLWTGFKVQVEVKDPLQAQLHASSVNVQRAVDGGRISSATMSAFTYQHASGDRTHAYASAFAWWYAGFPGQASTSVIGFTSACSGMGGGMGMGSADLRALGMSDLVWDGNAGAWNASNTIFMPTALPPGVISRSYNSGQLGFTFTNTAGTGETISVSLNATVGMQPLVLEAVNQAGTVTVSPLDVAVWPAKLAAPARARVAVVPRPDGSFSAYAVVVFTGF